MKNIINKILKEDWEWVDDIGTALEIGQPISQTNPKNMFRIQMTHGHGEESSVWSDNWVNLSIDNLDQILDYLRVLNLLYDKGVGTGLDELINQIINGNISKILKHDYTLNKAEWDEVIEDGDEGVIEDWIREILRDMGLLEYNDFYGDLAEIERFWITYFDEFGIEHSVNINYDLL